MTHTEYCPHCITIHYLHLGASVTDQAPIVVGAGQTQHVQPRLSLHKEGAKSFSSFALIHKKSLQVMTDSLSPHSPRIIVEGASSIISMALDYWGMTHAIGSNQNDSFSDLQTRGIIFKIN